MEESQLPLLEAPFVDDLGPSFCIINICDERRTKDLVLARVAKVGNGTFSHMRGNYSLPRTLGAREKGGKLQVEEKA